MILRHQNPQTYIELPLVYEHRLLNVLLNHKELGLNLLQLVSINTTLLVFVLILLLVGRAVRIRVKWVNRATLRHFVLQIFDLVEEVDTAAPIEIIWLQDP